MKRRDFIKTVGLASSSLVGACKVKDANKLIPLLVPPEDGVILGEARYLQSYCSECPAHCGMSVRIADDRPVKLEGNIDHPINRGALCIRGQASLERRYHPGRYKSPFRREKGKDRQPLTWDLALETIGKQLDDARNKGLVNCLIGSRTTGAMSELLAKSVAELGLFAFPQVEPINHGTTRKAYRFLFGLDDLPTLHFERADFILTIGVDPLGTFLSPVLYSRTIQEAIDKGAKWQDLSTGFSLTGANAENRISLYPGGAVFLLHHLLISLPENKNLIPIELKKTLPNIDLETILRQTGLSPDKLAQLTTALVSSKNPILVVGETATAQENGFCTAVYAGLIQWYYRMISNTVDFSATHRYSGLITPRDLLPLLDEQTKKGLGVVILHKPQGLQIVPELGDLLGKAALVVLLSDLGCPEEKLADIVLPITHSLEQWDLVESDSRTKSIGQPTTRPLFDARSSGDVFLELSGKKQSYRDYVREMIDNEGPDTLDSGYSLHDASSPELHLQLDLSSIGALLAGLNQRPNSAGSYLVLAPSLRGYDGRSADLALLREIPDPLTTISYGKYISCSPSSAEKLNAKNGDQIRITTEVGSITAALFIQDQLDDDLFSGDFVSDGSLHYSSKGLNEDLEMIYRIKTIDLTGNHEPLPILSGSTDPRGREILDDHHDHEQSSGVTLYEKHYHSPYRFAMAIDLDRCNGCSACVAACYVENNIAITGPVEHLKGREMSWLRIEPYRKEDGSIEFLPMLCQHCDSAPCESVCPVYATYHNPDGLNAQVYNRCVGTRYCANNCPYKVRRFNWFEHHRRHPHELMDNPELSKRPRGVMEKCTFCVQRIRAARDLAKDHARTIRDGEVTTACAQTCPKSAITFGNILDKTSKIYALAHDRRTYRVLSSLGTEPSVYYLKEKS